MDRSWHEDDVVGAWAALLRVHAMLVPTIDADLQAAVQLPLRWYDVMLELDVAPNSQLRMIELGDAVVLSRTRVSRVVDELVVCGYVKRDPNPEDRRSAFATLTPAGRRAFRTAAPRYLGSIRRHVGAALTEVDAAELRRLLELILGEGASGTQDGSAAPEVP